MKYYKYNALGNSFLLMKKENSNNDFFDNQHKIKKILSVEQGIGADGLLLFTKDNQIDFYNLDGSTAAFCGNGIRAYYAYLFDFSKNETNQFIKTIFGGITYSGKVLKKINNYSYLVTVKVKNSRPTFQKLIFNNDKYNIVGYLTKIGVDHYIITKNDNLDNFDELIYNQELLEEIQQSEIFQQVPNIDLVEQIDDKNIKVTTFERGVGYTASCGSGGIAAAYLTYFLNDSKLKQQTYKILTKYGKNKVLVSNNNFILTGLVDLVSYGEYYG